jgi:hypothetical protein
MALQPVPIRERSRANSTVPGQLTIRKVQTQKRFRRKMHGAHRSQERQCGNLESRRRILRDDRDVLVGRWRRPGCHWSAEWSDTAWLHTGTTYKGCCTWAASRCTICVSRLKYGRCGLAQRRSTPHRIVPCHSMVSGLCQAKQSSHRRRRHQVLIQTNGYYLTF